jgi:ABC-type transport system involved in cytochrome c biogenesis ATPase subunit
MDAPSIARLAALLLRHASQGGSALIATHDALEVAGARTLHIGSAR